MLDAFILEGIKMNLSLVRRSICSKIVIMAVVLTGMGFSYSWLPDAHFHGDYHFTIAQNGLIEIRSTANSTVVAICSRKVDPDFYGQFLQALQTVNNQSYENIQFVISIGCNTANNVAVFSLKSRYNQAGLRIF